MGRRQLKRSSLYKLPDDLYFYIGIDAIIEKQPESQCTILILSLYRNAYISELSLLCYGLMLSRLVHSRFTYLL